MKHFRDLVLSTKEPVLHNVLWIKPIGIAKYRVYMYEDGWKPLFGGSNGEGNGISYDIIKEVSDGYIVQFIDETDPNNVQNLYPKTKAIQVWLSNGINVEEAINNINRTLTEISLMIKKARFVTEQQLNSEQNRNGNTYWVYTSYNENTGLYIGEGNIRKYTSNNAYTNIGLATADIVMNVRPTSAKLAYVESMAMSNNGRTANIQLIATKKDLNTQINNLINTIISDVQVDGDSVVTNRVANIRSNKRIVYIVTSDIFSSDYPEGEARADKTFLIRTLGGHPTDNTNLVKYNSTGLEQNATKIPLFPGDLLFNIDEHNINNDNIIPYALYVYDAPQYAIKVHPIGTKTLVEEWIGDSITDAISTVRNIYVDFVAGNPRTSATGVRSWDITSNTTVAQIESYYNTGKNVYAKLNGIENAAYQMIPEVLPLRRCGDGFTLFASYGYNNKGYELDGHGENPVVWVLRETPLQVKLIFDNTPTQGSGNILKSGDIYTALQGKANISALANYVLQSVYDARMAVTPKFHRAEFLDSSDEYVEGTNYITDDTTHYIDPSTQQPSANGCFESLWWAVYECNIITSTTRVPKLILRRGSVACYCWSDYMAAESDVSSASQIILKFFDGNSVETYDIRRILNDITYGTYLTVTKTTQNVTLT